MTEIALYGGPLKRTLIQRAFGLCGQASTEFELSAEEYELGLNIMNDVAATFGAGLNFNFPTNSTAGSADEESGLAAEDVRGFIACLAQELGPNIGKDFKPNGSQASAMSTLKGKYTDIPFMQLGRGTPRGAGNRMYVRGRPYFVADISDDEVVQ